MPPDRGAAKRTTNIKETKKETKVTTSRKDAKEVEEVPRRVRSVKDNLKVETTSSRRELGKDPKKPAQKTVTNERITSKKRVDVETNRMRDVTKDLKKIKESLAKNRVITNSPQQTPSKMKANGSVYDRLATKTNPGTTKRATNLQKSSSTQQYSSPGKALPSTSKRMSDPSTSKRTSEPSTSKRTSDQTAKPKIERRTSEKTKSNEIVENKRRSEREKKESGHQRTKTRTLSPHEIKFVRGLPVEESQVTQNTVKKSKDPSPENYAGVRSNGADKNKENPSEYDYEDDFEDYESDFEEDIPGSSDASTSASSAMSVSDSSPDDSDAQECEIVVMSGRPVVEEEKKLDSGNYDLAESGKWKTGKELQQIKAALEKENVICVSEKRSRGDLTLHSKLPRDEGFEEEKVERTGFINFESARQHMQRQKESAQAQQRGRRGRELLSMIALDTVAFSLLDIAPVSYDVYMKTYGRANTVQAHVQTNEDNLSEEVQCDEIVMKTKWTQHPVTFHTDKDDPEAAIRSFAQDRLGCGSDDKEDQPIKWQPEHKLKYDPGRLSKFILQRGQFILQLLDENSNELGKLFRKSKATPVTSGYISFSFDSISFIKGRPVSLICFTHHPPVLVATVHNRVSSDAKCPNTIVERSMICIWNVMQPSCPQKILVSSEDITAICFDVVSGTFLFGGHCDGAVCLWDLHESTAAHRVLNSVAGEWVLFSPTYSSAEILKSEGHLNRVLTVQSLAPTTGTNLSSGDAMLLAPQQVCTLDSSGLVIVWTVIPHSKWASGEDDLGLAHWGSVRLVPSICMNTADNLSLGNDLQSSLECRDLQVDLQDSNHIYVCTNTGHIVHCLKNGGKPQPRIYTSPKDECSPATCIESCPFDEPYFLVGHEGGVVKLYVHGSSRPLASYAGEGCAVRCIQWSAVRPTVFYVLDAESRIHVWDLGVSDIHPIEMVVLGDKIMSMKLSQMPIQKQQYLAVTTAEGKVYLHRLRAEYSESTSTTFDAQLRLFLLYTSFL